MRDGLPRPSRLDGRAVGAQPRSWVLRERQVKPLLRLPVLGLLTTSPGQGQAVSDTERLYAEDQLTVVPVVLRQPAVVYPDSLRRAGIGGTVRVSVVLDKKGHPDSTSVRVESSPDATLNAPAEAVVLGARFTPGRIENHAVRARLTMRVEFNPGDTGTAPAPVYATDDSLSQSPALVTGAPLEYPTALRQLRIQGRVMVQMIVDTLGRPEPESIQFAMVPDPGFVQPVLDYLAAARFRPARRRGRPVRVLVFLPFDFRLRGSAPFPCPVTAEYRYGCRL